MKTKSRAVRRNSCGYALQDDVTVSGGAPVDDSRSPTPVSEGFVSGVSVFLDADSVPGDAMIEGDGFGCSVDMAGSLGSCHGHSAVVDAPLRMSGGITINEPDCFRAPADARFQQLPGYVDCVGKVKRKVDDVVSPSYDGSGDVDVPLLTPWLPVANTDHMFLPSSSHSGVGTAHGPSMNSQSNDAWAAPEAYDPPPGPLPVPLPIVDRGVHVEQPSRVGVSAPSTAAYALFLGLKSFAHIQIG